MADFLVDEDLPRSLAEALRQAGHTAIDVRDIGLRGRPDSEIRDHAAGNNLTVLTGDLEYGNLLRFPHHRSGTVIVRLSQGLSARLRIDLIVAILAGLSGADLGNCIGIIESDGLRLRRVPTA